MTREQKHLIQCSWEFAFAWLCGAIVVWAGAGICFAIEGKIPDKAYSPLFIASSFSILTFMMALCFSLMAVIETRYTRSRQRYKEKIERAVRRFRIA